MAQEQIIKTTFPDKSVPESKKGELYHRNAIRAIMGNSLSTRYPQMRERILLCQQYFNGTQDGGEFDFITTGGVASGQGDERSMPAKWISFQDIRNRVELLIGELIKRGFEVEVNSINRDAKAKKLQFKKEAIARIRLRPVYEELAKISGVEMGLDDQIPWEVEELERFMETEYKTTEEMIIKTALDYNLELYQWKYKRLAQFRDILIAGMCFSVNEIRNGYPQLRILQPENVVFDYNSTDDFLSDSQYFGEVEYMNAEDVVERYGLSMDEIDELYNKYIDKDQEFLWNGLSYTSAISGDAGVRIFQPFADHAGSQRVLVFRAVWMDISPKKVKVTVDPYGNEHVHILEEEDKNAKLTKKEQEMGGVVETRRIAVVRQATLIGGDKIVDWGLAPNQPRDIDNPSETRLPYQALIPNYVNYEPISKVWELKNLQDYKNILMYKIQQELATSGRRGFTFNTKYLPEGYEFDDVLYHMKAHGVTPVYYDEEIHTGGERIIEPFDNSMSQNAALYIQLVEHLRGEMDSISGINPARQGSSVSGREGLGVTQMQLVQSSTMTEKLFELFKQYESRVFQAHADMIKIAWPGNEEKFRPILGDLGVDFLTEDVGVDLNDYGVFVEANPPIARDRERFEQLVIQSVSAGFPMHLAMKVLMEKDLKRAIKLFEIEMDKSTKENREFQMQMQQMASQAAMQEKQMDIQGNIQEETVKGEYSLAEAKMKKEYDKDTYSKKQAADMKNKTFDAEMEFMRMAREDSKLSPNE